MSTGPVACGGMLTRMTMLATRLTTGTTVPSTRTVVLVLNPEPLSSTPRVPNVDPVLGTTPERDMGAKGGGGSPEGGVVEPQLEPRATRTQASSIVLKPHLDMPVL